MIRVLHVIDSLGLGGAQTILLDLAKHLSREQFHLEVAVMHGKGPFYEQLCSMGIPVHSLSAKKWPPGYLVQFPRLLKRGCFDIVHFHLFGANWIAKPLAALFSDSWLVTHDHCNDALRWQNQAALVIDAVTNQLSDVVFAVSNSTRQFLLKAEGLSNELVKLLYNGVDTQLFCPVSSAERLLAREKFRLPREGWVIGGVGRLVAQKNFRLFLKAAALLRREIEGQDVHFVIAGEGPEMHALRSLAEQLGVAKWVHFLGFVSDRKALFAAMDVLWLSSDFEGLPMTVLEALASEVALVATPVDGVAEILVDGEDVCFVRPGNEADFVNKTTRLMNDVAFADCLKKNGRQKVEQSFNAAEQIKRLEQAYIEIISGK